MVQDLGILVAHGRVPGQAQLQLDSDVLTRHELTLVHFSARSEPFL